MASFTTDPEAGHTCTAITGTYALGIWAAGRARLELVEDLCVSRVDAAHGAQLIQLFD